MKKYWYLPLVLLVSITQLVAQPPKASLLWEICGNGLKTPSYLFGTMHLMCKEDFAVSEVLKNKIKSSKKFYGEVDMDQFKLQAEMMSKMVMQGQTLQSLLGDADYEKVSTKFQAITGMPMAMMNNFKPFLCLSFLALNSLDCSSTVQPETELSGIAKENKIPLFGLETIDDQLRVIDQEPLDSQVIELKKSVLNFDSVKNGMAKLLAVYKKRNTDSLYLLMKTTGISEDFELELLNKRNKKWVPLIEQAIKETPVFFAVGAGHLGGPEGVISLLKQKGYRLTPVKF